MPARPKCPDCTKQLRTKSRDGNKWRYCEDCGWDERGKFEVTVWGQEGEIVEKLREASADELAKVEEEHGEDPLKTIMADPLPQNELTRS